MNETENSKNMNNTDKSNANNSDQTQSFGEKIKAKWNKLTDGDVKDIGDNIKALESKVSSIYNKSKDEVQREIAELQKTSLK